ncbi:FxsA family protein [Streptacidiphilus sp. PB12-B1b]|nr:FxsA family protein [Streptacidiphilus sp. PB12-B1b]
MVLAAWVVLEIWLLIEVGHLIGWFWLFVLLVASAALGGWVVKRAGLRALRATAAGKAEPGTVVGIAGGLLLILPGLLSDLLGLACLFPPTASLLRRLPARLLRRSGGPIGDAYRLQEQLRMHRPDGRVVPGEVIVGEVVEPGQAGDARPYDYGRPDRLG